MAVRIANGVNVLDANLAGNSVATVRNMLTQALNIDEEARTLVNGEEVAGDCILADGDELEFVKASGVKGLC